MDKTKRKSQKRWEQFNRIVDVVAPSLPTSTHVAVLLCCFRHGRQGGYFRASTKRIAESAGLKKRQTQYILDELEQLGVITFISEHKGPIPRVYQVTFKPANGAAQCTIKRNSPPDLMVHSSTANGALQST